MRYVSDVPRGDAAALEAERAHVVAHLSAAADEDDDPTTNADDVRIEIVDHPDDPALLRIVGELDAEPTAGYLQAGFEPLAGIDPVLFASEVDAAIRDEEVLRG